LRRAEASIQDENGDESDDDSPHWSSTSLLRAPDED
jgi:hypothetical protein